MKGIQRLLLRPATLGVLALGVALAAVGYFVAKPASSNMGFVAVPHAVPEAALHPAVRSRVDAIAAVGQYWASLAGKVPDSVSYGSIDFDNHSNPAISALKENTPEGTVGYGRRDVWVITYKVNLPPPAASPNPNVRIPNIHTMAFIVDDSTGTVLESKGYFD